MRVYNKREKNIPEGAVYVGRPGKWGNPFTHKKGTRAQTLVATRDEAVSKYREWILTQPELMGSLHNLKGKDLVCWCAPAACHADVLLELANKESNMSNFKQCKGTTKAGKPCKGGAKDGFDFCGPHLDQMERENTTVTQEEEPLTFEEMDAQLWDEIRADFDLVISGTGSRSLQLKPEDARRVLPALRARLKELKQPPGNVIVMAGGAEGFDSALVHAAKLEGIPYILALPSKDYGDYYWRRNSVTKTDRSAKFQEYVDGAYRVIYVCENFMGNEPKRPGKANFDRNQYMVDHGDFFFAYDPTSSGTKDCVRRIKKVNKPMEIV